MSNFLCEHCGAECIDSPDGYIAGCVHYPPDRRRAPKSTEDEIKAAVAAGRVAWCSRECQVYTGRCSCEPGKPRCVPA